MAARAWERGGSTRVRSQAEGQSAIRAPARTCLPRLRRGERAAGCSSIMQDLARRIGAHRAQLPALGGRRGKVWDGVARLLPRTGAEQMLMQGVKYAAVTDKKKELIGMSGDPPGNDGRDARKDLLEGIGVGGQYMPGGLVGPEAVTYLDLTDDQSVEAPEVAFHEPRLAMERRLEALGDDGR